jgi:hypothetical protein
MVKAEYANAYTEVLEILKYIPKEDFNKIPDKKIKMFSQYANYDYKFEYDPDITLKEQTVSDIAQTIIAILFRDYWATDEQREKIIKKEKYDMQLIEEAKRTKYNVNVFQDNNNINSIKVDENKESKENKENTEVALVEYKESIIMKFFNKIKNFLNIKK